MSNITITQQLKSNIQQIELIKNQNHLLLSQFILTNTFLELLNETKLEAEPIETYVINNTIQIKYNHKHIGFKVILTDKEIIDSNIENIFKEKVSARIKEIEYHLDSIDKNTNKLMKKFDRQFNK